MNLGHLLITDRIHRPRESAENSIKETSPLSVAYFANETRKGLALTAKVLIPTWLGSWLIAGLSEFNIDESSLIDPLKFSRNIDPQLLRSIEWNNTSITAELFYKRSQESKSSEACKIDSSLTDEGIRASADKELIHMRNALSILYPEVSNWLINSEKQGKLKISNVYDNDTAVKTAYYNKLDGSLTLFQGFFSLNDTRKIAALVHEYTHYLQPWSTNANEFFDLTKIGARTIGRYCESGMFKSPDLHAWARNIGIEGGRSEREAYACEVAVLKSFNPNRIEEANIDNIIAQASLDPEEPDRPLKKSPFPIFQLGLFGAYGVAALLRSGRVR